MLICFYAPLMPTIHHKHGLLAHFTDQTFSGFTLSLKFAQEFFGTSTGGVLSFNILREKHTLKAKFFSPLGSFLRQSLLFFEEPSSNFLPILYLLISLAMTTYEHMKHIFVQRRRRWRLLSRLILYSFCLNLIALSRLLAWSGKTFAKPRFSS